MAFVGFWMIPLMFLFSLFLPVIGFFETLTGAGQEKVTLPYDAENGVVWEYNEDDYSIIDCLKSETKDGQQVFTFRGKEVSDEERPSSYDGDKFVDDLYFEDENGNIKKYFAFVNYYDYNEKISLMYGDMDIYEETECVAFEYTVKAKNEVENCYWYVNDYDAETDENRFLGEEKIVNMHERTYQFVLDPENTEDHTLKMTFNYRNPTNNFEKIEVTFEVSGKEVRVVEETHYVKDENHNFVEVA